MPDPVIAVTFGTYDFTAEDAPISSWEPDIGNKYSENKLAMADGSKIKDIYLGMRIIKVKGSILASTPVELRTALDLLMHLATLGEQELTLFDDRKILAVALPPVPKFFSGMTYAEFDMTFLCPNPFFEKVLPTEPDEVVIDSSPKEFEINNPGSEIAYPIITITADKTITNLILQNETDIPEGEDEGLKFQYQDPAFFNGNVVVVDSNGSGTVYRETTNTIRYFTGAFLRLLPGVNTFKYTGDTNGATKVKFEFYERFL